MANSPLDNLKSRYEDLSNNTQVYTPSDQLPITSPSSTTITPNNESFLKKATSFLFSEAERLGQDIAEYTSPDVKYFRKSNNELRAKGGNYAKIADEMETMYGEKPDNLAAKTLANAAQTAMWLVPSTAGFKVLKGMPVLQKALSFGAFGGVYAGLEGVSEGDEIGKILDRTMKGFGAGATLGFAGHYFLKYGTKIPKAVSAVYQKVAPPEFRTALGNILLPVGSRLSALGKEVGQYGKKIMDSLKTIRSKEMEWLGNSIARMVQIGMVDMKGVIKSQTMLSKTLAERIDVTRRLVGMKPKIVSEELDTAAQVIRAEYMQVYDNFSKVGTPAGYRENYFNHVILNPEKQLSPLELDAFKLAKTPEEKFAILNKDETRGSAFKWAIDDLKTFKDYDEAYNVWSDWAKWVDGGGHKLTGARGKALISWLMKTGQAESIDDANRKLLRSYGDYVNPLFNKSKFLEHSREIDLPFYDPDPQKYMLLYLVDTTKRIAELSVVGPKGIDDLLGKLQKAADTKVAQTARAYVEKIQGTIKKSPLNDTDALSWIRSLNAPKLVFTQITNLGQSLSTLMTSDLRGLAHGITAAFKKEGVIEALKSGVGVQEILRANLATYRDVSWAGKWGDWNLKWSGFSWTERFNRVVAAHSFMDYARRELNNLLKNPTDKIIRFRLGELDIDSDEALRIMSKTGEVIPAISPDLQSLAQEAQLLEKAKPLAKKLGEVDKQIDDLRAKGFEWGSPETIKLEQESSDLYLKLLETNKEIKGKVIPDELESMIKRAGFTGANKTQFINLHETLPYWFSSPTGKIFTQFKSYSYNQVRLVAERLSGRVKAGDYAGLIRDVSILGILFPMHGEVAEDFRALVTGKKRPMNNWNRYVDNITSAGAFGLGIDLFNTFENKRLLNWMAGPTVGTASDAIENAYADIMKGEISDKTYRMIFSQLGFPRALSYRLYPPRKYDKPVGDPLEFWNKIVQ